MKTTPFFVLILSVVLSLNSTTVLCQYDAHTQLGLPEGVKARLSKGQIRMIAYSPDGSRLAAATGIGTWIYDTQSGKEIELIGAHQSNVRYIAYSPDGKTLATAGRDRDRDRFSRRTSSTLRLWDTTTGKTQSNPFRTYRLYPRYSIFTRWVFNRIWESRQDSAFVGCYHRQIQNHTLWTYKYCIFHRVFTRWIYNRIWES